MDESTDKQRSTQLSQFFDDTSVQTNPFGANQSADQAYRRAERIVAALYLITNHIPGEELLRVSIRSEALTLLERILSLRDTMRAVQSEYVEACRASIRYLISLVRMLSIIGLVSTQNTNIVMEGLDELGNFLSASKNSALSENVSLSRKDLFEIHTAPLKDIKDSKIIKDRSLVKDKTNMSEKMTNKDGLSVRELSITAILRSGGELGIKDIASNLPEYSEKMIQRDLVRLVDAGRVKKTGLKRWSRYSIKS